MFIFTLYVKQMRQENDVFWRNVQRVICKKSDRRLICSFLLDRGIWKECLDYTIKFFSLEDFIILHSLWHQLGSEVEFRDAGKSQ